jgi:hypothetical protein
MSDKIFISYAHEDRKFLKDVKRALRDQGIIKDEDSFIIEPSDKSNIKGGNIRELIKDKIKSANKVVIISSDKSESSQWVNYEAGMADALNKPIIVVGTKPSGKTRWLSNLNKYKSIRLSQK